MSRRVFQVTDGIYSIQTGRVVVTTFNKQVHTPEEAPSPRRWLSEELKQSLAAKRTCYEMLYSAS
jgi:hypothetical protein